MEEVKLGIYVPSYGRANTTTTYKLIDDCTYVVRKSEEQAYREAGVPKIWAVDDDKIDNLVKASNYINDHSPEEIIFTIDDDVDYFLYRLDKNVKITDRFSIKSFLWYCLYLTGT